ARAAAARVSAQLIQLLAIYHANENSLRLAIEDHDLLDFCDEAIAEIVLPPGSSSRIEVDKRGASAVGAWAFDAYQVKLVLQEAIRNALRHGRELVRFSIAAESGGGVRFSVQDDGDGFPDEVVRGEARAMNSDSSGLGLAFARLIAKHHTTPDGRQGRIELGNDAGGGGVFSLVLP
ncbi:MAG TPA: ATP-binding protein, partial [Rhodocyclaceae bacterium]|nr:ATP-binding protein [Rhodocyclaceae bacterium]